VTTRFRPIVPQASPARPADAKLSDKEAASRGEEEKRAALLAAELERAKEEGHGSGYNEGWNAAAADVRARLETPLTELAEALQARLAEVDALLAGIAPDIARMIVQHAIDLAEAVVAAPCAFDRAQLARRLISEAAAEKRQRHRVVCLAHSDTIAALEKDLRHVGCTAESCPDMAPGGVILRITDLDLGREIAEWDASVARQVELLRKLLIDGTPGHGE
jgi:flagellar biosynthesis/type III secretory pathway protein FliH